MHCPTCRRTDVSEIQHTLPDATEVTFFSCHHCEEKWWNGADGQIDLTEVLARSRATS